MPRNDDLTDHGHEDDDWGDEDDPDDDGLDDERHGRGRN